jgi:sulfite oxidase
VKVDPTDPYADDPARHPGLKFHATKPCNAEVPAAMLMDSWITPNDVWFIRHHHPVPEFDVKAWKLNIDGIGVKPLLLSLEDLKSRFDEREVTATLQCGGNRRSGLNRVLKTSGIDWGFGAISTARFKGVLLRDVLLYSGMLTPELAESLGVRHIIFEGEDGVQASIPIEKALDPYGDVLLAYEMNGEPLPREHGAPLRVVVPGVVGIRNIKWLTKAHTSTEEAQGPWQRGIAYKGFSPNRKNVDGVDVESVLSIQETPVTSCIVAPQDGGFCELDSLEIKGFAWSGGGKGIVRVDVSLDGGRTWVDAELFAGNEQNPRRAWAWTFWKAEVDVPENLRGKLLQVVVKATDAAYNCQPERPEPIWNLRGLNNNSWHRVNVQHRDD